MKRFIIPIVATAMLASASFAYAETASGAIKAMDPATFTVTLDDGTMYVLDAKADMSKLKAGDKVAITFDIKDGKNMATAITAAM